MPLTPAQVLGFTICAACVAVALEWVSARHRRRVLRKLAAELHMTYSQFDSLRLTPRVAARFPIPGAANLRITDVIYGTEHDRYRYVYRVEFTIGVMRPKRRRVRIAAFSEPRERGRNLPPSPVLLAPEKGSLVDQYRHLAPTAAARRQHAQVQGGAGATGPVPPL